MGKFTGEELKKVAADVFVRYPGARKVACTDDGQVFIIDQTDMHVKNHARKNNSGRELEIHPFTREGIEGDGEETVEREEKDSPGKGEKGETPVTSPGEEAGGGKENPVDELKQELS